MSASPPKITHLFQLEHTDSITDTHRFLDVMVSEQGDPYLAFTTKDPGVEALQTVLPLGEVAMDMLYHALHTLQHEHEKYPNRYASIH